MERESNIEALRILSMLLITMHHYAVHGGFVSDPSVLSANRILIQVLAAGGKLGVDCFVLITGYFMIESSFKAKKLIRLWFEVFFYSATIFTLLTSFGFVHFSLNKMMKAFFPTIFHRYWFATTYVVLYIFSPYLNQFIKGLNEEKHFYLILLLVVLWSVIPTLLPAHPAFSFLGWLITLYLIGAYIRLYPNNWFKKGVLNFKLAMSSYGFIILSIFILDIIGLKIIAIGRNATILTDMNKLPVLFCGITLFLGFKNLHIKRNKTINKIASSMFAVYLIHDNRFMRPVLWEYLFKNNQYYNSPYLILHAFLTIFVVFSMCILIDQIRVKLVEKPFLNFIEKNWDEINSKAMLLPKKTRLFFLKIIE